MATLIEWITTTAGVREAAGTGARPAGEDEFQVRPLPNENIFLWVRPVDNSKVMAQAEPRATRAAWKSIAASLAFVGAFFVLLLPVALNVHAGYRIHALKLEQQRLLNEQALLEQRTATLLSPERLAELAAMQELVDPAPEELAPLPPASDGTWARRQ
jgi:hypothetical protein